MEAGPGAESRMEDEAGDHCCEDVWPDPLPISSRLDPRWKEKGLFLHTCVHGYL